VHFKRRVKISCSNCGVGIAVSHSYCHKCGVRINEAT
jgi:uncharacterized OB-fold protein